MKFIPIFFGFIALFLTNYAHAEVIPGLLSIQEVRKTLEQHPSVAAARANLAMATQEAALLENSPYEWTAKVVGQRRQVQTGARYQEWNASVEHGLRLPNKSAADKRIANAVLDEAQAHYGEALHEAARELLSVWMDSLGADQHVVLVEKNLSLAQSNLSTVEKRVKAGDASQLDFSLAKADLAEYKRLYSEAKTISAVAWGKLSTRFVDIKRNYNALPALFPVEKPIDYWRERILSESDELKIVQAQTQKIMMQQERVRLDKIPDPTFGVFTASEVGGQERITGISISIPIPSGQRSKRADIAVHHSEKARQNLENTKRQLQAEIEGVIANAMGNYESFMIAEEGNLAMQNSAQLIQKAYSLGEVDLQSLLTATRLANSSSQNTLSAQVAAIKAYYLLLIDAHLVWNVEHD